MNKCYLFFFITIFLVYNSSRAQEISTFNLQSCIEYALDNSYQQKSFDLEVLERQTTIRKNTTHFLPQIDAYANYINYFNDLPTYIFPENEGKILSGGSSGPYYPVELGLPNNLNLGIKINQVIYDHNFFLKDKYKATLNTANQLNGQFTREEIIYNVSQTYYKAGSLKAQIGLISYNLERLTKIEKTLESQIKNGFARETEKSKILINRARLITNKNQAEAGLQQLLNYLKFLMGMSVEVPIDISIKEVIINDIDVPDTAQISDNIKLQLIKSQIAFNELEQEKLKNDYYPKLNAFAHFRFQAQRDAFNFFSGNEDWYLINLFGISLDIPILHGGDKRKNMELYEIKTSQMELNKIRLEESLKMDYENAKNNLINNIEEIRLKEENVKIAKDSFDQTTALFEEGLVMLSELLETESMYREMENELVTAKYSYKLAELNYLKATGNLLTYSD